MAAGDTGFTFGYYGDEIVVDQRPLFRLDLGVEQLGHGGAGAPLAPHVRPALLGRIGIDVAVPRQDQAVDVVSPKRFML
jgi:hypothetical protein